MAVQSSGTIDDDDIAGLIALLDRGRQAWIDGALGFGPDLDASQDDDMTILGPFGWVLRTTQVFERRDDGWVRRHRHADPLIDRRTPAETFALAGGRRLT